MKKMIRILKNGFLIEWKGGNTFNVYNSVTGKPLDCFTIYKNDLQEKWSNKEVIKIINEQLNENDYVDHLKFINNEF